MRINREEVFGPVASVIRVKDYEEALATGQRHRFGLSAGIATTSLKYATHFKRHAQAGMVMVNLPTAGVDYHVPFGGRKGSSYGPREQGRYAAEFFTTVKTAYTSPDLRRARSSRTKDRAFDFLLWRGSHGTKKSRDRHGRWQRDRQARVACAPEGRLLRRPGRPAQGHAEKTAAESAANDRALLLAADITKVADVERVFSEVKSQTRW